ncbi:MAG: hypothetical protein KME57_25855, partial [Scytonema hyalinum WJT4-NPBG1]|nr:hypothetical protein [Scytonema hyalinum WJT4-NPBG1]
MGVSNTKLAKNASNDSNCLSCLDARSWCNARCTDERHHKTSWEVWKLSVFRPERKYDSCDFSRFVPLPPWGYLNRCTF